MATITVFSKKSREMFICKNLLLLIFFLQPTIALCQGARVTAVFVNGEEAEGELLVVRDTTLIVLGTKRQNSSIWSKSFVDTIVIVASHVNHIVLHGESKILESMGRGTLIGAGAGALIGLLSGNDDKRGFISFRAEEKALIAGAVLGAGGLVIGTVVGIVQSYEQQDRSSFARSRFLDSQGCCTILRR